MARKRFISSNMSVDEDIGEIAQENPTAALMWPWLLTAFDDWGRMEITSAIKIKLEVFPAFPFKSSEIEEALLLYVNYGLAYSYMVGSKKFLAIEPCKFYKYQTYIKEKNRLEDKSKCPAPIDPPWKDCPDCRDYSRTSAEDRGLRTEIVLPPPPSLSLSLTPTDNKIPPPPNPPPEEKPVEEVAILIPSEIEDEYNSLGTINQTIKKDIRDYLDKGIEPEVIIEAIKETAREEKRWRYTIGILQRCLNEQIFTLMQYNTSKAKYAEANKNQRVKNNSPPGVNYIAQHHNYKQREYPPGSFDDIYEDI